MARCAGATREVAAPSDSHRWLVGQGVGHFPIAGIVPPGGFLYTVLDLRCGGADAHTCIAQYIPDDAEQMHGVSTKGARLKQATSTGCCGVSSSQAHAARKTAGITHRTVTA